jgi:hypothetical protein
VVVVVMVVATTIIGFVCGWEPRLVMMWRCCYRYYNYNYTLHSDGGHYGHAQSASTGEQECQQHLHSVLS